MVRCGERKGGGGIEGFWSCGLVGWRAMVVGRRTMTREFQISLLAAVLIVGGAASSLVWATTRVDPVPEEEFETFGLPEVSIQPVVHALFVEEFSLSPTNSINKEHGVELIGVDRDGTTHIRATGTKRILSAKPGGCFSSAEFGQQGLVLRGAGPVTQIAMFVRVKCEPVRR